MENTSPSDRPGAQRYRVLARRTGRAAANADDARARGDRAAPLPTVDEATREIVPGEPTVVVFGPSLADADGLAAVQRIARTFPEVGVVLLAEELTLPLLQDALRAGVRDAVTIDAGERQIRQAVERVGETMAGVVDPRRRRGRRAGARSARSSSPSRPRVASARAWSPRTSRSLLATRNPGRVVLVDADLQFGDDAVLLGVPPQHTSADAAAVDRDDRHAADGRLPRDARSVVAACAVRAGRARRR